MAVPVGGLTQAVCDTTSIRRNSLASRQAEILASVPCVVYLVDMARGMASTTYDSTALLSMLMYIVPRRDLSGTGM